MKPKASGSYRAQKTNSFQGEGPNWVLIAGGALLSTLSIRLGFKLKQAIDSKQQGSTSDSVKGNGKPSGRRKSAGSRLHSNIYSYMQDDDGCFNCISGDNVMVDTNHLPNGHTETDVSLPLVTVPAPEYNRDNGALWAVSSPDRLELPPKPFHHSNCSDSPCISDAGSDIFTKREVIHKLRQQLKRRDDMILEMQDQILELQNSLKANLDHSTHLQEQLDAANRELFESEREIQRLRKAIADHCVASPERISTAPAWPLEARDGHGNGYVNGGENGFVKEADRVEMLRKEVRELKEVMEGKEYLLQSYKEQKSELAVKVKELQQRLDNQLPNIL